MIPGQDLCGDDYTGYGSLFDGVIGLLVAKWKGGTVELLVMASGNQHNYMMALYLCGAAARQAQVHGCGCFPETSDLMGAVDE